MSRSDIEDTLHDMWATRPRRRKNDKKIAGVAAAIARRYQIDPTLVRIAFVVTAIYGHFGFILYLLGWLLLPENDDETSPAEALIGRGRSSMSAGMTVLLGLLLIPASFAMFSHPPQMLLGLGVAGAALFLLHRHRGGMVAATAAAPAGVGVGDHPSATSGPYGTAPPGTTVPIVQDAPGSVADADPQRQSPPAWDPLGVAPFAWDLPEPQPEPAPAPTPPPRKHKSAVTPVTIGLALVAAGIMAVAAMYDGDLDGRHVAAGTLAVLGGGLVIGSFVRGGRGLIPLAIPLAVVTWGMTAVPVDEWDNFGNREYAPATVAEVLPHYELTGGNLSLDLTSLDGQDVTTKVELHTGGNIEVTVPEAADVEAVCSGGAGNVQCLTEQDNGWNPSQTVNEFGEDGKGGGTFDLELINHGGGNIELKRGS